MVQSLRIHVPMQEIQVQSLVWEDLTCQGAAKPTHGKNLASAPGACDLEQAKPLR